VFTVFHLVNLNELDLCICGDFLSFLLEIVFELVSFFIFYFKPIFSFSDYSFTTLLGGGM
jgi:hypothetical protein